MSVAVNIVKAYLNRQTMVILFCLIFFGFFHDTIILLAKIAQGESNEKKKSIFLLSLPSHRLSLDDQKSATYKKK